jgi:hypothetical protein
MSDNAQVIPMRRRECPYCGRLVRASKGIYVTHSVTPKTWGDTCPMSGEHCPITGHSDVDYVNRAHLVANLAWRIKDEDPADTWRYLTMLPADEVQRLLMLALAAVPVDRSVEDLFEWVCDLPDARAAEAAAQ